jgi:hypothetical protein
MGRCEGYYRLENRRCDRDGHRAMHASDGELYVVCAYHERQAWNADVARWQGETGLRASRPTPLGPPGRQRRRLAWA